MSTIPVGEVRPSQLLWTYGPGALVDLPNLSVVTLGLHQWDTARCRRVDEVRLLDAVRRRLGPQVEKLLMPPVVEDDSIDPFSPEALVGVPVKPFPRWLRCVKCQLLAEVDSGLFRVVENRIRPERTQYLHVNCPKGDGRDQDAVPARFLLACRNGHLDDFPWRWFAHGGPSDCRGTLRFLEESASLQTQDLFVRCDDCGSSRSLAQAFGARAAGFLPGCRGRHPHLDTFDEGCDQTPRAVLLGATNSWFPVNMSALAIPIASSPREHLLEEGWDTFQDTESLDELRGLLKGLKRSGSLPGIEKFEPEEIWSAIEAKRSGATAPAGSSEVDLKRPEWRVLTDPNPRTDFPHFLATPVSVPPDFSSKLQSVLLLERLREVNALIGYTRVEAPEESSNPEDRAPMAALTKGSPTWIPATEVHGEGIFIRFREDVLAEWEGWTGVDARDAKLREGHRGWRSSRKLSPDEGYPGIRYALLHTFSHLLIRELALECGYNAASIRERIYAAKDGEPMAGILIYTAAADSDGTLGGLVQLGKPENLGRLIRQALQRARICSSDPLCSEHDPGKDRSIHAAACHACGFVAETSCEKGNRYLDRALLLKTFETSDAAFFGAEEDPA
jgi:hypothetical protein